MQSTVNFPTLKRIQALPERPQALPPRSHGVEAQEHGRIEMMSELFAAGMPPRISGLIRVFFCNPAASRGASLAVIHLFSASDQLAVAS